MAFYAGQKVVCINDGAKEASLAQTNLVLGDTYTIHEVFNNVFWELGLLLVELKAPHPYYGYHAYLFRPVTSRSTDISIFTALLGPKVLEDA